MSSSCMGKELPKEKKWGVKDCRERKCPDLQNDPMYPKSPQMCSVTHGMPGSMSMCVKEMDDEHFIRQISGQLNLSPYDAPRPGIKNCPENCPYKLVSKVDNGKGKLIRKGHCALTGDLLGTYGVCPCNVLGNPRQEDQINQLRAIVEMRQEYCTADNPALGMCAMGVCPDGKDRERWDDGNTNVCPVISITTTKLAGGRGCPLWRIPAKLLPAPDPEVEKESRDQALEKPKTDTKVESSSRKKAPKKKPERATKKKGEKILEHKPEGKYLYTIRISHRKDTPCEYVLECMKHKGQPHGVIHMGATGEKVTETVPDYLTYWTGMDYPAPDPYNKPDGNLQYEDETGLFPAYLFFNNDGTAKKTTLKEKPATSEKIAKPVEQKQAAAKKKKEPKLSEYRCDTCPISSTSRGTCKEYLVADVDNRPAVHRFIELAGCAQHPALLGLLNVQKPEKKKKPVFKERPGPRHADLFSFDESAVEARPVELLSTCLDCLVINSCKSHDPHAGCERETQEPPAEDKIPNIGWCNTRGCMELDKDSFICVTTGKKIGEMTYCPTQHLIGKPAIITSNAECVGCRHDNLGSARITGPGCLHPDFGKADFHNRPVKGEGGCYEAPRVRKCCPICGHHKTKKTFEETCPRVSDLMFKGGKLSANDLMLETSLKDCGHWIPKPTKTPKKKTAKQESEKP